MNAEQHMEAALRTDLEYCRRKAEAHPAGGKERLGRRLIFVGIHPDISSMYERQYQSAEARLERWLAGKGR